MDNRFQPERAPSGGLAETLPGADLLPENMRYPLLYHYSQRISRLVEWDGSEELGGLGIALLAGGLGAWLAGEDITSKPVLLSLSVGTVLLVAGFLVRRASTESCRSLKRDFNRDLSLVEKGDPTIRGLRDQLRAHEAQERADERWKPPWRHREP